MKRETSNGNAYLANCPIPADSIIFSFFILLLDNLDLRDWFFYLTLKEHSTSNLECSKLFYPGVVMAEKDKCGKFWPLGFVSAQLSGAGGWKSCCEIWKPSLEQPERGASNSCKQHSSEGLENLAECKRVSLDLELDWAEWKCSERGASSQLQPIEISLTSWLLGTICRKCNCTRVNVAEHQKVHFAAIAATFSVTRATPRATEFFSSPLLRPHAHCQSGWAQVKLCPTLLLHWRHTLSFLLNSKFIQMHLQQELFTIYAIRGCIPSTF